MAFKAETVTFTICRGIPASGKSTWTNERVRLGKGMVKRVNRDDLRAMIDASVYSKPNEAQINALRRIIISYYLESGCDVIVDDTNLTLKHVTELAEYAESCRPG